MKKQSHCFGVLACLRLSIFSTMTLCIFDAADVLFFKRNLFNLGAEKILFVFLFTGVAVLFSVFFGLLHALLQVFLKNAASFLKKITYAAIMALAVYISLEYGTYLSKPKIWTGIFLVTTAGYFFLHILITDLKECLRGELINGSTLKTVSLAVVFCSLCWINARMFFNQNFLLHLGILFVIYLLLQIIFLYLFKQRILRNSIMGGMFRNVLIITLACLSVFSVFAFDISQNVKRISFEQTSIERFMLYTLKKVVDFDQDGYTYLFGGGDSNDFNGNINPQAQEIPDNGIDENGFCGDYKEAGVKKVPIGKIPFITEDYNIVLIIIDALRPDHMGSYGYARNTTPFLDSFYRDGFIFERAYAQASHTRTSLPSFTFSMYQPFAGEKWRYQGRTMAELLKEKGYATLSVIFYRLGDVFLRGYDSFSVPESSPKSWDKNDPFMPLALKHIDEEKGKKFFLWLHLPYPHHPYVKHSHIFEFGNKDIDRYDNEIRYADTLLQNFYEALEKRRLLDKTIMIVMADHGEEFFDHGGQYHNSTVYDEQIHVPLLLKIPGMQGRRIYENVQLIDLSATLLNLAGAGQGNDQQGRVFSFLLKEDKAYTDIGSLGWDNWALSGPVGSFQKFSLIKDDWKLDYNMKNNFYALYDIEDDPHQQNNLIDMAGFRSQHAEGLISLLHSLIENNNLRTHAKN